jgi:hypothetical protein
MNRWSTRRGGFGRRGRGFGPGGPPWRGGGGPGFGRGGGPPWMRHGGPGFGRGGPPGFGHMRGGGPPGFGGMRGGGRRFGGGMPDWTRGRFAERRQQIANELAEELGKEPAEVERAIDAVIEKHKGQAGEHERSGSCGETEHAWI